MKLFELVNPIEYHNILNPKLWDNDRLRSEVRGALLRISEDFIKFVDIPFKVLDIVIAGGNANYNYTAKSDIDLHIISDISTAQCEREAEELFDAKRLLYKEKYDLKIHAIPVELYIEDIHTPAVSSSYSILKDRWVKEPNPNAHQKYDEEELERMVEVWHTLIQHAIKTGDLSRLRNVKHLLKSYRVKGLQAYGEFGIPNLVFKSLRNDDTVAELITQIEQLHDKELSIT